MQEAVLNTRREWTSWLNAQPGIRLFLEQRLPTRGTDDSTCSLSAQECFCWETSICVSWCHCVILLVSSISYNSKQHSAFIWKKKVLKCILLEINIIPNLLINYDFTRFSTFLSHSMNSRMNDFTTWVQKCSYHSGFHFPDLKWKTFAFLRVTFYLKYFQSN